MGAVTTVRARRPPAPGWPGVLGGNIDRAGVRLSSCHGTIASLPGHIGRGPLGQLAVYPLDHPRLRGGLQSLLRREPGHAAVLVRLLPQFLIQGAQQIGDVHVMWLGTYCPAFRGRPPSGTPGRRSPVQQLQLPQPVSSVTSRMATASRSRSPVGVSTGPGPGVIEVVIHHHHLPPVGLKTQAEAVTVGGEVFPFKCVRDVRQKPQDPGLVPLFLGTKRDKIFNIRMISMLIFTHSLSGPGQWRRPSGSRRWRYPGHAGRHAAPRGGASAMPRRRLGLYTTSGAGCPSRSRRMTRARRAQRSWCPLSAKGRGPACCRAQGGDDGDAPLPRLLDRVQLAGHQVDAVGDIVEFPGEKRIPVGGVMVAHRGWTRMSGLMSRHRRAATSALYSPRWRTGRTAGG